MSYKILETNNYSKFELGPFNRDIGNIEDLMVSMKRYGFLSGCPITVKRKSNGKLMIILGHHRFRAAEKLGIPIKYVEEKEDLDPYIIEKPGAVWNLQDWLTSRFRNNLAPYVAVRKYHTETGIPLNCVISMLAGDSAGSGNHQKAFKNGTYKLGDPTHSNIVKDIVLHLKGVGVNWATNSYLIHAISKVAWVQGFSPTVLKKKIGTHRQLVQKQSSKQAYVDMIDAIYNYGSRQKMPLSFLADEAAKQRNVINKTQKPSVGAKQNKDQQQEQIRKHYNLEVLYS
jgi:hypothetical protein